MKEKILFYANDGSAVRNTDMLRALENVGACDASILFIHTGQSFGLPAPGMTRSAILEGMWEALSATSVETLCVPTFTFSFCNGQSYDVMQSKSQMGALNEYIRKLPHAVRSADPLMSVALVGERQDLLEGLSHNSVGAGSFFDRLHHERGVKFLFFGTNPGACMTYTHYVEACLSVPYRYYRDFTGLVTTPEHSQEETYSLFVRYNSTTPAYDNRLEIHLMEHKLLQHKNCGNGSIFCVDEEIAFGETQRQIEKNPNYMLSVPYDLSNKDTTFCVSNMVAL